MVLVNPFEGLPFFLSNTRGMSPEQKVSISKKTGSTVCIILLISLFFGSHILTLLGISTASFSLAGGLIILIIALQMVLGKGTSGDKSLSNTPEEDVSDIAVVPLAIPLLAGPGPISSIIVYGSRSSGIADDLILSGIVVLVSIVVLFIFSTTTKLEKIFTQTRVKIITKISGLLVAAIAVEMIFTAIVSLINLHSGQ